MGEVVLLDIFVKADEDLNRSSNNGKEDGRKIQASFEEEAEQLQQCRKAKMSFSEKI